MNKLWIMVMLMIAALMGAGDAAAYDMMMSPVMPGFGSAAVFFGDARVGAPMMVDSPGTMSGLLENMPLLETYDWSTVHQDVEKHRALMRAI